MPGDGWRGGRRVSCARRSHRAFARADGYDDRPGTISIQLMTKGWGVKRQEILSCVSGVLRGPTFLMSGLQPESVTKKVNLKAINMNENDERSVIHRETNGWVCVKQCGACCRLAPEERPDLDQWLTPDEWDLYMNLVGDDGWCRFFDKERRTCSVFDRRPEFCRATPATFSRLYGISEDDFDAFARSCCVEQIHDVYGGTKADEMKRFVEALVEQRPDLRGELEAQLRSLRP